MPNMTETPVSTTAHQDPFAGFASNPDKLRAYSSCTSETQLNWMQKSSESIKEFLLLLPQFSSFLDAYSYLAVKRHEFATEHKQKSDEGRTEYYGTFRKEGDHARRTITSGDGEQFWKWQKNKIFELTYRLIDPLITQNITSSKPDLVYENEYITALKERVSVDERNATYFSISIKFPSKELFTENFHHSKTLSHVELYSFDDNSKFNLIRIEYVPVDNRYVQGNYQIADYYYKALLKWQHDDGIEVFYSHAAKLSYLIAHLMPVKQGNAAIMEWLIRSLAFKNGIELGHFNHAEGISWDFKALLTPNLSDYIHWFSHNLFDGYTLFEKAKPAEEFHFPDKNF